NYYDCMKHCTDDDAQGLDFGVVPIHPHYQRLMERGGIVPLSQNNWDLHAECTFDGYGILGFPEEKFSRERKRSVTGSTVIGGVRAVLMMGSLTDAVPKDKLTPASPWLAIALKDQAEIASIVGMSGGPILGFQNRKDKPPLYQAVGIQSFWD